MRNHKYSICRGVWHTPCVTIFIFSLCVVFFAGRASYALEKPPLTLPSPGYPPHKGGSGERDEKDTTTPVAEEKPGVSAQEEKPGVSAPGVTSVPEVGVPMRSMGRGAVDEGEAIPSPRINPPSASGGGSPAPDPFLRTGATGEGVAAYGRMSLLPKFKFEIKSFYKNPLKGPKSVFVDREHGEIYVADPARGEALVFDTEGGPIFSFGGRPNEFALLDIVVRGGLIYLTFENKPYIEVRSIRGESVKTIMPKQGKFVGGRMDMDEDGFIYVINTAENKCLVLDKDDNFTGSIGEGLASLAGVAAGGGRVYLITPFFEGYAIHVYTVKGEYLMSFQAIEGMGGRLGLPVSGKVDKDGNLWLVDALKGIVVFDRQGNEISRFGGTDGAARETLDFPVDIDFNGEGMVYIVEEGAKRISVFK